MEDTVESSLICSKISMIQLGERLLACGDNLSGKISTEIDFGNISELTEIEQPVAGRRIEQISHFGHCILAITSDGSLHNLSSPYGKSTFSCRIRSTSFKQVEQGKNRILILDSKFGVITMNRKDVNFNFERENLKSHPLESIVNMCSGDYHALFLDAGGNCWFEGQYSSHRPPHPHWNGVSGLIDVRDLKRDIKLLKMKVLAIACGANHSIIITTNGVPFTFGDNTYHQRGGRAIQTSIPSDMSEDIPLPCTGVWCGGNSSFIQDSEGDFWVFGENVNGHLGLDNYSPCLWPVINPRLKGMKLELVASSWAFGTKNDALYSWGDNSCGQLGLGDQTHRHIPTKITSMNVMNRKSSKALKRNLHQKQAPSPRQPPAPTPSQRHSEEMRIEPETRASYPGNIMDQFEPESRDVSVLRQKLEIMQKNPWVFSQLEEIIKPTEEDEKRLLRAGSPFLPPYSDRFPPSAAPTVALMPNRSDNNAMERNANSSQPRELQELCEQAHLQARLCTSPNYFPNSSENHNTGGAAAVPGATSFFSQTKYPFKSRNTDGAAAVPGATSFFSQTKYPFKSPAHIVPVTSPVPVPVPVVVVEEDKMTDTTERNICTICMDAPLGIIFVPCGHFCSCKECSSLLAKCPICNGHIERKQVVYMP